MGGRTLDGVLIPPRHFDRFSAALDEVVEARIWGGIHFRNADVQGAGIGKKVAQYMRAPLLPARAVGRWDAACGARRSRPADARAILRLYRNTVIRTAPETTSSAPATTRRPMPSDRPRSHAENATPNSDSVATIGDTTDTVPR